MVQEKKNNSCLLSNLYKKNLTVVQDSYREGDTIPIWVASGPCGTENTKNPQNYIVNITGLHSMDFPPPAQRNSCPRWNRHPNPPICPWDNSSYPLLA